MKKIFMAAMTLVMAVFASCSNEDLNVENNEVKVKFTVAEKPGFDADSRSVKTGWDNDDQILVVFKDADGLFWLDAFDDDNTLKLTKTAEGWTADYSNIDITKLASSADYHAFYYPGEVSFAGSADENYMLYFDTYKGGEYLSAAGTYTVNGSEIVLGKISMTRNEDMYQISVEGLASENGNWTMSLQRGSGVQFMDTHLASGKLRVATTAYNPNALNVNENAGGVKYDGDVQFCFLLNSANINPAKLILLSNGTDTYEYQLSNQFFTGGATYLLPEITDAKWNRVVVEQ